MRPPCCFIGLKSVYKNNSNETFGGQRKSIFFQRPPDNSVDNRAFEQLMHRVKNAPELGGGFSSADLARSRERLCRDLNVPASTLEPHRYAVWEYLAYLRFEAQRLVLRPLAATAGVAGLMFTGWVATVSAGTSLPGDMLYPVKIASERIQLSLASTSGQRLKLHAEFAEHRLQEAVDLTSSKDPSRQDRLKTTVADFKDELNSAHGELSGLQKGAAKDVIAGAAALSRKTAALSSLIDQAPPSTSSDVKGEVAHVREAVKDSQEKTVGTLVQTFETTQEPASAEELKHNFQTMYQHIQNRLVLDINRLATLRVVARRLPAEVGTATTAFAAIAHAKLLQEKPLATAMDIMAAGGYRRAFELIQGIDAALDQVEQDIAQKEIELTTGQE